MSNAITLHGYFWRCGNWEPEDATTEMRGFIARPSTARTVLRSHRDLSSFIQACTAENIDEFLAENCEPEWVLHVNGYNLDAELEFIERNDLNPTLVDGDFAYPLWALESSESFGLIPIVEAYKALFDDFSSRHRCYDAPEKVVHLMSRQAVRNRLSLPPLTQGQIDAFYAQPRRRSLLRALSHHPPRRSISDVSHEQVLRVCEFLKAHYPDVVAYWVTLLTKAEVQGYVGWRAIGGHSMALSMVDSTVAYFGYRTRCPRDLICELQSWTS